MLGLARMKSKKIGRKVCPRFVKLGRKGGLGQKCRVGLMKVRQARREWPGRVREG